MPMRLRTIKALRGLLPAVVILFSHNLFAIPQVSWQDLSNGEAIAPHFELLIDQSGQLSVDQVRQSSSFDWQAIRAANPSYGFNPYPHWFRGELVNNSDQTLQLMLQLKAPNLDKVAMYFFPDDAAANREMLEVYQLGDLKPFSQRPIISPDFVVPVTLPARDSLGVYIKVETQGALSFPLQLSEQTNFQAQQQTFLVVQGFFFGLMFTLAIYNVGLFIGIRSREYLYLALSIMSGMVFQLAYNGLGYQFLWGNWPTLNLYVIPLSIAVFYFSVTLLASAVLRVRDLAPQFSPYMQSFIIAISVLAVISLLLPYTQAIKLLSIFGAIGGVGILCLSLFIVFQGNKELRPFVISWATVTCAILLLVTSAAGLSDKTVWTTYALELSSGLIIIWTSASLSNRINRERREKMRAESRAQRQKRKASREQERYLELRRLTEVDELNTHKKVVAAEASNRAQRQFLANISHEIRTPMNGILGINQLLSETTLSSQQRHYVNIIANSGQILLRLINDLLDYSKINAGKLTLEAVAFNLREFCVDCVSLFEESVKKKGLNLVMEINTDDNLWIKSDPTRLKQVLHNLLDNALKFTREGNIAVTIEQTRRDSNNDSDNSAAEKFLRFAVQDSGIGIEPGAKIKLFDAFTQANPATTREFGGTGLGLSICKQIVEHMGGTIGVESELHQGSCFWFTIPLITPAADDKVLSNIGKQAISNRDIITADLEDAEQSAPTAYEKKILVAEDNPVNQIVIAGLLKKMGFQYTLCASGDEAIDNYTANPEAFHCILMDCEMPKVDGFEATTQIRLFERGQRRDEIPIIAVTAHSWEEYGKRLQRCGFSDHLAKPIDLQNLKAKLIDNIPLEASV